MDNKVTFPCNPKTKAPLIAGGFKSASNDPAVHEEWGHQFPKSMMGLPTGAVNGGLLVIDLDRDINKKLDGIVAWQKLISGKDISDTKAIKTPRGGQHLYFSVPDGFIGKCSAGVLGDGIDIRSDGGYVIAEGSITSDGAEYALVNDVPIAPAPDWLLDLCAKDAPASRKKTNSKRESAPQGGRVDPASTTRNNGLTSYAGSLRHFGASQEQLERQLIEANAGFNASLEYGEVLKIAGSVSQYPVSVQMLPRTDKSSETELVYSENLRPNTDAGNAERFVDLKQDELRYVFNLQQWLHWTGIFWEPIGTILEDLKQVARSIALEGINSADEPARNTLIKHAIRSESKDKLNAMRTLAEQTPALRINAGLLDLSPHLIGTPTGVVDLRKGQIVESKRDQWITMQTSVGFNPDAECPRWEKFIDEIMGGDAEMAAFMQRLMGSMLYGANREHLFVIVHGGGANGKSVAIETVKQVTGMYAKTASAETFIESGNSSGPREDLLRLRGARAIFVSETKEGDLLDEQLVKSLTGGDTQVGRGVYARHSVEYAPQFLPVMATNHKPVIKGTDDGIWRRLCLVPFNQQFKGGNADKHLTEKLAAEKEGILRWMVEGAKEYLQSGLQMPELVSSASHEYRTDMDLLGQWMGECCENDAGAFETASRLYVNYCNWAKASGSHPVSKSRFSRQLEERGFQAGKQKGLRGRKGIRITGGYTNYGGAYTFELYPAYTSGV
jgi:putative DNA primase/helicase